MGGPKVGGNLSKMSPAEKKLIPWHRKVANWANEHVPGVRNWNFRKKPVPRWPTS